MQSPNRATINVALARYLPGWALSFQGSLLLSTGGWHITGKLVLHISEHFLIRDHHDEEMAALTLDALSLIASLYLLWQNHFMPTCIYLWKAGGVTNTSKESFHVYKIR